MKKDISDVAFSKRKKNQRMTLREWQITVCSISPSSLWNDFFPDFLGHNGVSVRAKMTPVVWQALFDVATKEHKEMLDKLVAENPPFLVFRGRPYLLS
jgi:hypothetical protein